jgi:cytochrome b561
MPTSDRTARYTIARYTRTAIVLHWVIAFAFIGQYALGWWMQEIPKQPAGARADVFNLHKSIGLTILALMLVRIAWRLTHTPPAMPPMDRWQSTLARLVHIALYTLLIVHPLAGYLGSVWSGYPVKLYGMTLPAWGSKMPALKDLMSTAHLWTSWLLAGAVLVHLGGVLKHTLLDGDRLLARMGVGRAPKDGYATIEPLSPAPSTTGRS